MREDAQNRRVYHSASTSDKSGSKGKEGLDGEAEFARVEKRVPRDDLPLSLGSSTPRSKARRVRLGYTSTQQAAVSECKKTPSI